MAGELGSQDGPLPTGLSLLRARQAQICIMRRQIPSNRPAPIRPLWLLTRDATSRAWDNPVVSLPPETAGGPVMVASARRGQFLARRSPRRSLG